MNDKSNLSPTRRLFASESFRRHYVSAVENGEQADWGEREQSGNLGRVFVFLLLLHVFLIGAIVLYNIVSDRPKVSVASSMGKSAPPMPGEVAHTTDATVKRSELGEYQVRSGDTVQSIADATGATTDEIVKLNQLDQSGELYVGRRLQLPVRKDVPREVVAPAPAMAVPVAPVAHKETTMAAAKEVSSKATKGQPEAFKAATASSTPATKGKTSPDATPVPTLIKAQPVTLQDSPPAETRVAKTEDSPPTGRAGTGGSTQKPIPASPVKLQESPPKEKPAPKATPVVAEQTAKERPAAPAATASAGGRSYEIKGGDTFYSIARKNGISVNALTKANPGTNPSRLQKGMVIKIPAK